MTARVLRDQAFWALRAPFDLYLPDSVQAEDVNRDRTRKHERFRKAMSRIGREREDWELPGHYQHVRVFYAYLYNRQLYIPRLTEIIQNTMKGFEEHWIGEFECYGAPGCDDRRAIDIVYHGQGFVFTDADFTDGLIPALGLTRMIVE